MWSEVGGKGNRSTRADGSDYQQRVTAALGNDGAIGLGDDPVVSEKVEAILPTSR